MSAKDSIATQTCELSKEEFNDFLTLYPIPSEYHVILPKSNQTVFDAPPGYLGLYTHSFSLANLRLPLTEFFCEVLEYFQVHISRLNPFGYAKLTTFVFMCKAYGCEPSVDLFRVLQLVSSCTGSLSVLVNTEPLKADEELVIQPIKVTIDSRESPKHEVFVVHLGSVAARIKDMKCKTRGGLSRPPVMRKFAPRSSTSSATHAKTSSLKDDVPFLIVSDDDEGLWNLLDSSMTTATQDKLVVDNDVNKRSRELLQVIEKLRGEFDVMKDMEWDREEECEELWVKCEAAMTEFEKNPTVVALQEKISTLFTEVKEHKVSLDRMMLESQKWPGYQLSLLTLESKVTSLEAEKARLEAVEVSLRKEVEELKQVRREVVSKVVPYATMELVYSDHMSSLVERLVSSAIFYGRCRAYKQVADMKEPFDLSKVKDPTAPIEALLSKKPPSL
ncbi:hypothetical protein Tco_0449228 [Tanacetum coccineum]